MLTEDKHSEGLLVVVSVNHFEALRDTFVVAA